ncbi:MAG: hypothetical protein Q9169_000964 [Polycauliona sp. 2 TL-2023]
MNEGFGTLLGLAVQGGEQDVAGIPARPVHDSSVNTLLEDKWAKKGEKEIWRNRIMKKQDYEEIEVERCA